MKLRLLTFKEVYNTEDENVNHTFIPYMAIDGELKLLETLSRWNMSYKEYWRTE